MPNKDDKITQKIQRKTQTLGCGRMGYILQKEKLFGPFLGYQPSDLSPPPPACLKAPFSTGLEGLPCSTTSMSYDWSPVTRGRSVPLGLF